MSTWHLNYARLLGQLRNRRKSLAITQKGAADALDVGRRTFQRCEAGTADPTALELFRWAALLGVSISSAETSNAPDLAQLRR